MNESAVMPDTQSTASERRPKRAKWLIAAGVVAVLTALLVRPMINGPNQSTAQVVNQVPVPQVTMHPPADADKSEKTISTQAPESDADQLAESREAAQLRALDAELAELDASVAEKRQEIEAWYVTALARLKAWAENRCKVLGGEERAAWAWCLQQIRNTRTYAEGRTTTASDSPGGLRISSDSRISGIGYPPVEGRITQARRSQAVGNPARDYQVFLMGIGNSRDAVQRELNRLRETRSRYLAELETLANGKRAAIEARRLTLKRDAQRRIQGGPGLLDGIFASGGGYGAMIDGEVVYEGSSINGYRVHRITRDSVQFEKNGQAFTLTIPR
jgi:hypothetical protein